MGARWNSTRPTGWNTISRCTRIVCFSTRGSLAKSLGLSPSLSLIHISSAKPKAMSGGQEIGKQLDNGMIAGVNAGKSGVINAVVSAVQEAIAAAQALSLIHI